MNTVPLPIQNLARQLLGFETARGRSSDRGAAVRVCEKLRGNLSKFTGSAGFSSLLARALALAKADVPLLSALRITAEGTLEGFDEIEKNPDAAKVADAEFALIAHLLGLLAVFIGETLTLRLVRDIWPAASMDKTFKEDHGGVS